MNPTSRWHSVFLSLLLFLTHSAHAFFPRFPPPLATHPRQQFLLGQENAAAVTAKHVCNGSEPNTGVAYFDQLLDHSAKESKCKLSLPQRTFKQRYFWSNASWGGPGYPVIVMSSGESDLEGMCNYLYSPSLIGKIAERVRGAVLLVEHRYYGESSPFPRMTTQTLQQLTLHNAVHDLTYLARNVKLPFDTTANASKLSNAPNAPWILSGGSYSGALSAWTAALDPGTFWAYHASSAPVQAIYNFWQYFEPIRAGMPANCSRDLAAITEYVDNATMTLPPDELAAFKDEWGLGDIVEPADFASFYMMCDVIEGYGVPLGLINGSSSGNSSIVAGIRKPRSRVRGALPAISDTVDIATKVSNVASFFKNKFLPGFCYREFQYDEYAPNNDTNSPIATCLNSLNTSSIIYTDRAINNTFDIQWSWMLCNEPFAWWQTGQTPPNIPAIASRLMTPEYFQQQCDILFGPNSAEFKAAGAGPIAGGDSITSAGANSASSDTYGSATGKTVETFNALTSGWEFNTKRILWVNGEVDPWRPASVSSTFRPEGPLQSTPDAPVILIDRGRHCEDLYNKSNSTYLAGVIEQEVKYIAGWVDEFYDAHTKLGQNRTLPRLLPMKK